MDCRTWRFWKVEESFYFWRQDLHVWFFVIVQFFHIFVNPRWSLSLQITVSWGIELEIMFLIVLLKKTFVNFLVNISICKKSYPQKITYCFSDISSASLLVSNFPFICWWIINFKIEFYIRYLMMVVFVYLRMYLRFCY